MIANGVRLCCLVAVAVAVTAGGALADGALPGKITARDQARLDAFDATRAQALAEARAGGSAADLATLDAALAGTPMSFGGGFNPVGDWRCRTLKLGRTVPLVVYGWMKCRITDDGAGWRLEKLSGSQRTAGQFYTMGDTELVYLGVFSVAGDKPVAYGKVPDRDQVAVAVRPGDERLRLEFPAPVFDARFEILELERGAK